MTRNSARARITAKTASTLVATNVLTLVTHNASIAGLETIDPSKAGGIVMFEGVQVLFE